MTHNSLYPMMFWGDLASLASALSWSMGMICLRQAGHFLDSLTLTLAKNLLAMVYFAIAFMVLSENWLPTAHRMDWLPLFLSGVVGIAVGDLLFLAALRRLGATLQALVDCLYAPLVVILAAVFTGETLNLVEVVGGALVLGSIFVAFNRPLENNPIENTALKAGFFFGVGAQFCSALSIFALRDHLLRGSVLQVTAYRFLFGTLLLLPIWLARTPQALSQTTARRGRLTRSAALWLVLGAFFGPFLAIYLWLLGFKWTSAPRSAILNQMATVFTVILAAIILKEEITPRKLVAVGLGAVGSALIGFYS